MAPPLLYSVVIPTYNRAALLSEALDSVFAQDIPSLEAVVVDDGSTDGTAGVAAAYGGRVRYLRQANRGPAAARNAGVALAAGELIAFLDSDDLWLPGKLAAELEILARLPEADALISDCEVWDGERQVQASHFAAAGVAPPAGDAPCFVADLPPLWAAGSLVATGCITLRRRALAQLGGRPFDPALRYGEDWEFEIRLYHRCRVAVCPRVTARVRRFADGTRGGRGMPGGGGAPAARRAHARARHRVLRRAERLPGLSAAGARALAEQRREAARALAAGARGWHRLACLPLAAAEARAGDRANARRVLALGWGREATEG
jgi:glycosyl transferase family 2